ncbi:flagellar biosynthetic protein FliR [Petralouisia muris]|uniref:Flagellar biosynthetic protein FliR n=1 Tax=Petralouisia muris TaxID=3032872 RepID=A0AC61RXW7_9FIRM|nr:flagellar biosynthetic protein FliR [Petralouisia muris]TGY96829.1 flagellar biosynthetic protein FliR [Petralouisia muris]
MINYEFTLNTFEYFLMILVRVASFVFIAPFFGMNNTPGRVKIGLSAFLALILYQVILPKEVLEYSGVIEFAIIVLKEGITGLLIGFAANICNSIIVFSGKVIDMEIGLAMANIYDPTTNSQSGLTGTLYNYFIMLLLIVTDMHHYILRAFIDTYQIIPINGAVFDWNHLMGTMTMYVTDLMVIGFRIVLPIFATSMILNCILGIMAKVAPQMNMFAVGMQLKILIGFSVMFLTIVLLPNISNIIFTEMKRMIVSIIEGMY